MSRIKKRVDNLEQVQSTPDGYFLAYQTDEMIDVYIHDGTEPTPKLTMTRAEYEQWKKQQSDDHIIILVEYEDKSIG